MASIGERITATIIDWLIIGAYLIVMLVITGLSQNTMASIIISLPLLFYHFVFELTMNGQSPGKKAMHIRVFSEDGAAATFTGFFIRWVFRLIDVTMMLGSIATLFIISTKKNQRLGDMAGKTILLRTTKRQTNGSLYYKLPDDYTLQFPEVEKLSDSDMQTLNEVLSFLRHSGRNEESRQYARKLQLTLTKKMGINPTMKAEMFLITLKKDYNYIHRQQG